MIGCPFLRTFPFFIQTILSGKQNVTGAFLPRLNSQHEYPQAQLALPNNILALFRLF